MNYTIYQRLEINPTTFGSSPKNEIASLLDKLCGKRKIRRSCRSEDITAEQNYT